MFCLLKMKSKIFLNNFLIIMCVTMSCITCRPFSSSVEEPEDILGKCLKGMGCDVDTVHNLNSSVVQKLRWKLDARMKKVEKEAAIIKERLCNQTYELHFEATERKKERNYRLLIQSFISIYEIVDRLFDESWPKWAPNKPTNRYTMGQWKILLSNVEDPLIFAIRTNMEKNNISEEDFINDVQNACRMHNRVHEEMGMAREEKDEAIKVWQSKLTVDVRNPNTLLILLLGRQITPCIQLTDTVMNIVNAYRDEYKLVKIPNYYGMEEELEWRLQKFYSNPSDSVTKYNGFVVIDNAAYLTFENFQSAYYLWKRWVHDNATSIDQKDSVILSGGITLIEEKGKSNHMFVNLTIEKNELVPFEQAIYKKIQNYELWPIRRETYQESISSIEIFYRFHFMYPAIRFYTICKKEKWMVNFLPSFNADLKPYTDDDSILQKIQPSTVQLRI